jgi:1-acyl-sn-glycerol-3-phosphate acyltransferase
MKLPDVGKSSVFYNLLYWPVYLYYHIYYRSFKVLGRENVPADKPVIFAGNHQNALMDALSILFAARGKVVFLARADLFGRKMIAKILFFLRILPVYRIRDGISSMGQNEGTFQKAADVLRAGTPLALFPEGNHSGFKRLRSLKKGICRIAFMAEEKSDFSLDLHIIPSGIDYSHYFKPGADLVVRYGKPVRVAEFIPLYRENPQKALSALRDRLAVALEPLMINVPNEEYYDVFMAICRMYRNDLIQLKRLRNTPLVRLETDKEITRALDGYLPGHETEFESFRNEHNAYQQQLEQLGLRDWLFHSKKSKPGRILLDLILSVILLPLYLYGLVMNYLPYKLPVRFTKKVKDQVFHSSIHFGIGLLVFPFYYLILQILFSIFIKALTLRILFAISLPISGIFTFYFFKHLLKLRGKLRLTRLRFSSPDRYEELHKTRDLLVNRIKLFLN